MSASYLTGGSARSSLRLTVSVYAAGNTEMTYRNFYLDMVGAIVNKLDKTLNIVQVPYKLEREGYRFTGFKASFRTGKQHATILLLQCGRFFIRYRVNTAKDDSAAIASVLTRAIEVFPPADIVKKVPLSILTKVHVAPGIIHDTAVLDPILEGIFAKLKWMDEHVDSMEQVTGYPGLYLGYHAAAVEAMLTKWESIPHRVNKEKEYLLLALKKIKDAGFINEFLYDDFNGLLHVPEGMTLNHDAWYTWASKHRPDISLAGPVHYYILRFADAGDKD